MAHDFGDKAQYLGNEAILVSSEVEDAKINILFDPFFHQDFNVYTIVPDKMRKAIFAGKQSFARGINSFQLMYA